VLGNAGQSVNPTCKRALGQCLRMPSKLATSRGGVQCFASRDATPLMLCMGSRRNKWQTSRGAANRVIRGGSWNNPAENCQSAIRNRRWSDGRDWNLGFRVCLFPGTTVPHRRTTRLPVPVVLTTGTKPRVRCPENAEICIAGISPFMCAEKDVAGLPDPVRCERVAS